MLMSKSRLEKFLYALYSLDSSDLPTPQSRIEELYKCLVTGEEAPTFEPISRVEKYLMAILGAYDVDSLPNPLSRVEVLLYKLAIGDDILDDIKSFLSEHEELLAEIIRNGGAGGNIDIEYVLYSLSTEFNTLYNTAEKPVKSANLTGQTLVNLLKVDNKYLIATIGASDFDIQTNKSVKTTIKDATTANLYPVVYFKDYSMFKANTKYLALFNDLGTNDYVSQISVRSFTGGGNIADKATSKKLARGKILFTTRENLSDVVNRQAIILETGNRSYNSGDIIHIENVRVFEYQEGMENWDIPYFEGMQSVKMPVLTTTGKNFMNSEMENGIFNSNNGSLQDSSAWQRSTNFIALKSNTQYQLNDTSRGKWFLFYDKNKNFISSIFARNGQFTTPHNCVFIKFAVETNDLSNKWQIELGNTITEYEPYKTNILTVNEDVVLCGIGDVKDELNLLTGELTRRIGEVVFNGTEDWAQSSGLGDPTIFYTSLNDMAHKGNYRNSISCDKFVTYIYEGALIDPTLLNGITGYSDNTDSYPNENWLYIKSADSEGSVEKLKQWLSQNPVTVQYELTMESVKTVDLSVADQDGNDTKLSTFNDITHVTLSSEGLIPEAELEVATKNEEVLNTMSLEMDDISKTQNDLQETSNTQSENVDATMMATTEIYEGLL